MFLIVIAIFPVPFALIMFELELYNQFLIDILLTETLITIKTKITPILYFQIYHTSKE